MKINRKGFESQEVIDLREILNELREELDAMPEMTDKQKAVIDYYLEKGYSAYSCKYLGKTGRFYLNKDKHNKVINDWGYDEFISGYYPTNLVEIKGA